MLRSTGGPVLYAMCSLPFAGKSTAARQIAHALGLPVVSLDSLNAERSLGLNGEAIPSDQWGQTYLNRIDEQSRFCAADARSFTTPLTTCEASASGCETLRPKPRRKSCWFILKLHQKTYTLDCWQTGTPASGMTSV